MDHNENGKDPDQCFLDNLLNTLYDFGDAGGSSGSKKKRRSLKRSKTSEVEDEDTTAVECSASKDRDFSVIELSNSSQVGNTSSPTTKAGPVEVVVFQDPQKRQRKDRQPPLHDVKDKAPQTMENKTVDPNAFLLEKARLQVHKFGITGYQKVQQRVFELDRAIMLGAKPPKKEYVNYKVLQQKIQDKKQKVKEESETNTKTKKAATKKWNERRKSFSLKAPTGQLGRFKNGMLVLHPEDIRKIKTSKVRN
ncbi:hypothetical protein UPYG_G00252050 [Umbra pygmaea]|uniref:Uncharacterized protein n=1 Tax=Umbra pygmaea TaxID=75934 RepID=A0ABD0W844_UMBPY